jgi:MoxR-like ATPase
VLPQDVYDVSRDVLRHRVLLSFDAIADGIDADTIVERIVTTVVAPRVTPGQDGPIVEHRVEAQRSHPAERVNGSRPAVIGQPNAVTSRS